MIAEQAKLTELLQGIKQFEVPLYQRPYSWSNAEREQFWRDILRAGTDPRPGMHFTGSVVFMERTGSMAGNLKRARLIDGQQRLTTLSLLMLAVAERMAGQAALELPLEGTADVQRIEAADIREDYLLNKRLSGDSRFKLLPTHADRDTLKFLLGEGPQPTKVSREIQEGAAFFRQKLDGDDVELEQVLRGVHKLQVVSVSLEEGRDDPQLIFESLNSTGKDLSQADLIRNHVLMGLEAEPQSELSRDFWVPMEERFADTEEGTFDRFMRDFLTLRTRSIPNEGQVYVAFKAYRAALPESGGVKALVGDIANLARLYMGIVHPEGLANLDVRLAMSDLLALRLRVVSPFVLELLEDHEQGRLTDAGLVSALRLLESFVLRRAVVGERTAPLNRFFAALGRELNKDEYLRSLERALVRFQDRDQDGFPADEVFSRALQEVALYRLNVCKPLLVRLERQKNTKEKFETGTLTIEHVMPQNDRADSLSPEWQAMLGPNWPEVQERLVHTLGNLTLTGYNSELGDRPFSEKKRLPEPKGYIHSRLGMTREIAALPDWNEARITIRAADLAAQALTLWPFPSFSPEERAALRAEGRQRGKVKSVEDHLETSGPQLRALFGQVRERLLNLDAAVTEAPQKAYVAYKLGTNFCDIVPQPALNTVKGWLNIPFEELDDPQHLTRDITGKGKPGNGNVEFVLSAQSDLNAFESLARQSLVYQRNRQKQGGAVTSSGAVSFVHLPQEVQATVQELQTRTLGLGEVQESLRQFYLGFKARRFFAEVRPRQSGVRVSLKLSPGSIETEEAEGWSRSGVWLSRSLRTVEDLDMAWPFIVAAYEEQLGGELSPSGGVTNAQYKEARATYAELAEQVQELDNVQSEKTKKSVKFSVIGLQGPQEFMRLYSSFSNGLVGIRLNIAPSALNNPQGLGAAATADEKTAGFVDGHFVYSVSTRAQLDGLLPLIEQAREAQLG